MFKISREFGGWVSSMLIFSLSLSITIIKDGNIVFTLLLWMPILLGMTLYDTRYSKIPESKISLTITITILVLGIVAVVINIQALLPYTLFLFVYLTRFNFIKARTPYISTILGLLALTLAFYVSLSFIKMFILAIALFFYMVGSEFTVRAVITHKNILLIYNVFPLLFGTINPVYLIFSIALIRIPISMYAKKIQYIGISETLLLLTIVIFTVILSMLGFIP